AAISPTCSLEKPIARRTDATSPTSKFITRSLVSRLGAGQNERMARIVSLMTHPGADSERPSRPGVLSARAVWDESLRGSLRSPKPLQRMHTDEETPCSRDD